MHVVPTKNDDVSHWTTLDLTLFCNTRSIALNSSIDILFRHSERNLPKC